METTRRSSKRRQVSMDAVKTYLDQHYAQDLSLEALAENFGYSSCYLCRRFSEAFGCSLAQYLIQVRIRNACVLLETSRLSVCKIAHQVGFPSDTAFITRFKREMGITPHKYRILQRIK